MCSDPTAVEERNENLTSACDNMHLSLNKINVFLFSETKQLHKYLWLGDKKFKIDTNQTKKLLWIIMLPFNVFSQSNLNSSNIILLTYVFAFQRGCRLTSQNWTHYVKVKQQKSGFFLSSVFLLYHRLGLTWSEQTIQVTYNCSKWRPEIWLIIHTVVYKVC